MHTTQQYDHCEEETSLKVEKERERDCKRYMKELYKNF